MNKQLLLVGSVVGFLTVSRPMLARDQTLGARVRLLVGFVVGCWSGYETSTRPKRWYRNLISMRFFGFVVGLVGFCRTGREEVAPEV